MKIPSPGDCGLPEQFSSWRSNQEESIRVMITSKKRVVGLSAPTGFGKSPAYIAYALLSGLPTCVVTNSRGLQDQLMSDYSSIGLVDIRGRSNYPCDLKPDYTCEEGYASRCPYKGSVGCPASLAEMRAAASSLVVTNYDKWTSSRKFGMGMQHFQQVIFDEGHDAPEALAKAMQVILNHSEIEKDLKLDFPKVDDRMDQWRAWAGSARLICEEKMMEQGEKINTVDAKPSWVKQFNHLKNLYRRISVLAAARVDNWVVDKVEHGYQFDPIRPGAYAETNILFHLPKIVIVSATLRPKTLFMLGIPRKDFDFYEFDSDFDPKRCPVYWVPTMRVDCRADDLGMLWLRLDQIISRRRDRKGIIHTISYARRDDIIQRSRFASSMLINRQGEPPTYMVEQFKEAGPGTILVSPSIGEGYDFPGKTCEWQFICKVPFPDGRSLIMKARQAADPEHGPYLAMQSMVQALGRGMRSKEDRCESFLGDDHLQWFLPKYGHLAPRSFHSHFKKVDILPQPPERLT
jgi:Rad3-related DNA helicase